MSYATTDLSDAHPDAQVADPVFGDFGGNTVFHGPVVTLKVFEDNALVRALLEAPGKGQLLVVDGGGSARCALVGGNIGQIGVDNGWAGSVVRGFVRDTYGRSAQKIAITARGAQQSKSVTSINQQLR